MAILPVERLLVLMSQVQSVNNAAQNVSASLNGFISSSAVLQENADLAEAYPVDSVAYIQYLAALQSAIGAAMGGLPSTAPPLNE